MAINFIEPNRDGSNLRIGIVSARFNDWACNGLMAACLKQLGGLGVKEENITVVTVPGALEIPFALDQLHKTEDVDALIAIGCVIRGETYHFELVANESSRGITNLILKEGISIANCILTVEDEDQARARIEEKGSDAANVAVEMAHLRLRTLAKNA